MSLLRLKKIEIPTFVKNVLALSFGTILSQGINFLFLPFLSRLYSPEEFGLFYAFVGIAQMLGLVSTLKYEKSIILPKNNDEGHSLVLLTLAIITVYTCLVTIALVILSILHINLGIIQKYILLVPLSILCYSYLSTFVLWYQRDERFKMISVISVVQSIAIIGFSALFAVLKLNQNGLILGYVIGCFALVMFLALTQFGRFYELYKSWNTGNVVASFKKYIDFPKYYLLYDLFATGSTALIPVILTSHYSQADCGFYSMANRILMVPFMVISTSVTNVFMVNANKIYQIDKDFSALYKKTFSKIIIIGLVTYGIFFLVGGDIISLLLGPKWSNIGLYVKILSIMLFFEFITFVFKSNTYIIAQKQRTGMIIQMFSTLSNLSCLLFFANNGIQVALIAFTISSAFFSVINLFMTYRLSKA